MVTIVKAGAALHSPRSFQNKTIQLSAYKHVIFDAVMCSEYRRMCLRDTQTHTAGSLSVCVFLVLTPFQGFFPTKPSRAVRLCGWLRV